MRAKLPRKKAPPKGLAAASPGERHAKAIHYAMQLLVSTIMQERFWVATENAQLGDRHAEAQLAIETGSLPTTEDIKRNLVAALVKLERVLPLRALRQSGKVDDILKQTKEELAARIDTAVSAVYRAIPKAWHDEIKQAEFVGAYNSLQNWSVPTDEDLPRAPDPDGLDPVMTLPSRVPVLKAQQEVEFLLQSPNMKTNSDKARTLRSQIASLRRRATDERRLTKREQRTLAAKESKLRLLNLRANMTHNYGTRHTVEKLIREAKKRER